MNDANRSLYFTIQGNKCYLFNLSSCFNKARVHTTESLKSKVMITFVAMIVRNELFQKTIELRKKNRKYYTVGGIVTELENIEYTRDSKERYRRKYALTAKQKEILKQFDIDEKYMDRCISIYFY